MIKAFLIIVGVVFLILFSFLEFYKLKQEKLIIDSSQEQFEHEVHSLIAMNSAQMMQSVNDYSFWDEFAKAIEQCDTSWLSANISISNSFNYNNVCIYNKNLELIFEESNHESNTKNIIPKEALTDLRKNRKSQFFLSTPNSLMEICASSIHPTNDPEHIKTLPSGYMLVAKEWDQMFLNKLTEISGAKVKLLKNSDSLGNNDSKSIIASIELMDWNALPVSSIAFSTSFKHNFNATQNIMYIILGFIIMVLVIANLLARKYINRPHKLVMDILNSDNPNSIKLLKESAVEYGHIGNLFEKYVLQKGELKEAKDEAQESEAQVKALLQAIPDLIFIQDKDGVFIDFQAPQSTALFVTPDRFIGKNMEEVLPPEVVLRIKEVHKKTILTNEVQLFEYSLPMPEGMQYFEGKAIAYDDNKILSIIRDITERKRSEQALKESELKFKEIINQINDGIIVTDELGKIIIWNNGAEKIFGIDANYAIGKNTAELQYLSAFGEMKDKVRIENAIKDLISFKSQEVFNKIMDNEIIDLKLGTIKNIQSNVFPVKLNNSNLFCSVIRDTTELKEYEKQLLQLNADKDRFMSILGHDLKNPFNAILGYMGLLNKNIRKYNLDKIEQQLAFINSSSERFYKLLDNLLIWVNSQSGKIPFEPRNFFINEACQEILEDLKLIANTKEITIKLLTKDEIMVFADIEMTKTVLRNLVSNALKFTRNGGNIDIYAKKDLTNTIITISDNGLGMKPETLVKLFDFAQFHSTEGTAHEMGTGLGLLICKDFVEKNNGKIWVESEVDKGSKFKFTLPNA